MGAQALLGIFREEPSPQDTERLKHEGFIQKVVIYHAGKNRVKSQETGADIWIPLVEKFSAQITTLHLQSRPIRVILLADERKAEGNVSIHTLLKLLVLSPTAPLEKLELLKQLHLIIKGVTNYHYPKCGDPSDKWDVIERLARQTLFSGVFCLNLWIQGLVPILRQHLGSGTLALGSTEKSLTLSLLPPSCQSILWYLEVLMNITVIWSLLPAGVIRKLLEVYPAS
ncbi:hypothetical protein TURU_019176 [Turdus rufiventris]|nr:hypothetical protein TURU_019176 [Turdus rufiventris]